MEVGTFFFPPILGAGVPVHSSNKNMLLPHRVAEEAMYSDQWSICPFPAPNMW